ncbi:hypothetical protein D9Q98_007669 [Chlorella vulgaris]|uniref:SBP-type domain-containing protein n=1 Tax=Chlorella vulgaris TaxID=3077 RepID=A0A9D4THB6_CHLVU|nr:hypothetical protein D9Q98_007669 [Chlorella vulgaris]
MSLAEAGGDPGWRMETVDWDPVDMKAQPQAHGSHGVTRGKKKAGSSKAATTRAPNYCCQVEGCPRQLLPLRSYYQRQHICEEHFRALAITDISGRVTRFCQQCTKLEPLSNFDEERRSCRISLERRNQRRQGKRNSTAAAAAARARRATGGPKAAAAAAAASPSSVSEAPGTNSSGSGFGSRSASGSVTRVQNGSPSAFAAQHSMTMDDVLGWGAPGWKVARGPSAASASEARTLQAASQQPPWPQQLPLGSAIAPSTSAAGGLGGLAGYWVQQVDPLWQLPHGQAQSDHSGSVFPPASASPDPSHLGVAGAVPPGVVPQLPHPHSQRVPFQQQPSHHFGSGASHSGHTTAVHVSAMTGGGGGGMPAMSSFEIDQLLAMDADSLADAILQGSNTQLPSPLDSQLGGSSALDAGLPSLLSTSQPHSHHTLQQLQQQQWAAQAPAPAFAAHHTGMGVPASQAARRSSHQQHQRAWHEAFLTSSGLLPSPAVAVAAQQGLPYAAPQPSAQLSPAERVAAAQLLGDFEGLVGGEGEGELDPLLLLPDLAGAAELDQARICFKLYGVRPEQLPPQLRADLLGALALPPTAVQASMRAGCVHLTLTALLSAEERARLALPGAAAAVLSRLLPLVQQLPSGRVVAQLGSTSAALLAQPGGGRPAVLLSIPLGCGEGGTALPVLLPACPLATTVSAAAGCFRLRCARSLLNGGTAAAPLGLHCRREGRHLLVSLAVADAAHPAPPDGERQHEEEVEEEEQDARSNGHHQPGEDEAAANCVAGINGALQQQHLHSPADSMQEDGLEEEEAEEEEAADPSALVEALAFVSEAAGDGVAADADAAWQPGWGLYEFEVSQGALVGEALPLLVLPDSAAAAAAELASMNHSALSASLRRLVGSVLAFLEAQQLAACGGEAAAAAFQARYPPLAVSRLAAAARKLLDVSERTGWSALTTLLLPAAGADGWLPAQHHATVPQASAEAAPTSLAASLLAATESDSEPEPEPASPVDLKGGLMKPLSTAKPTPATFVETSKAGGSSKHAAALAAPVPELSFRDGQQRVMHPAVLAAATAVVAGAVLGVGVALVTGHLM